MQLLIVGSRGQLGQALEQYYRQAGSVALTLWSRPAHDLTDPAISQQLADLRPDVVINCAAWTNVDGAESQPEAAFAANADGPRYLALGCNQCGARLVQISTNEVFAGVPGTFYAETDAAQPQGVYARSKWAGEQAVREVAKAATVVRVAWLFGPGGNNFPSKIVAAADRHGQLRVVEDELGNPTYAPDVAAAVARLIELEADGTYHLVNEGYTSRYELARAVLHASGRGHIPVTPIPHTAWPRPVQPPLHAVLINAAAARLGITLRPWQAAVAEYAAFLSTIGTQ